MPFERREVDGAAALKRDVHHVSRGVPVRPSSICDSRDLLPPIDDAFGVKKSGRQLEIIARRAHRHGHCHIVYPDLERLFGSEIVEHPPVLSVVPLENLGCLDTLRWMAHRC
jgi:hypothetical protein